LRLPAIGKFRQVAVRAPFDKEHCHLLFRADTNRFPQRGHFQFSTLIAVTIATENKPLSMTINPVSQIDPIVKNFSKATPANASARIRKATVKIRFP
jgi:hypothetical protein